MTLVPLVNIVPGMAWYDLCSDAEWKDFHRIGGQLQAVSA